VPELKGCACDRFYNLPDCSTSYIQQIGNWPYTVLAIVVTLIMVLSASVTAWSLISRRCCASVVDRERMLPFCRNERELAALVSLLAALLRPVWFLDIPVAKAGIYGAEVFDALLLRLPQCLWMSAYLLMIIVWQNILLSAEAKKVGRMFRLLIFTSIAIIVVVALPLAVFARSTNGVATYWKDVGNGIMTGFVVLLELGGLYSVYRLRQQIISLEAELPTREELHALEAVNPEAAAETSKAFAVFGAIHNTFWHICFSAVIAIVLIVAVIVASTPLGDPVQNPGGYYAFVVVVHVFVEGCTAVQIAILTYPRSVAGKSRRGWFSSKGSGSTTPPSQSVFYHEERSRDGALSELLQDSFVDDQYSS
jgi:hypothetical protein